MNRDSEAQANKEYRDLLRQRSEKVMKRDEELQKRGLPQGLDGPDYYKYIDDWFDEKFNELKKKIRERLTTPHRVVFWLYQGQKMPGKLTFLKQFTNKSLTVYWYSLVIKSNRGSTK